MVIAELTRAGYSVAVPLGENNRYDLIAEIDGILARVQVKTGRLRRGAVIFNCFSSHSHRNGTACRPIYQRSGVFWSLLPGVGGGVVHADRNERLRTYRGAIKFFGVYCPGVEGVYLIQLGKCRALATHPSALPLLKMGSARA